MPPTWNPVSLSVDQLRLLDLQIFSTCGHLRLFETPGGWAVAYQGRSVGKIIGYGQRPTSALEDCYRKCIEEKERIAAGMTDEELGMPRKGRT